MISQLFRHVQDSNPQVWLHYLRNGQSNGFMPRVFRRSECPGLQSPNRRFRVLRISVGCRVGIFRPVAARRMCSCLVWRLNWLGQSLTDLTQMVGQLESRGVGLMGIHESTDTSSSTGRLVFHIFGALAEFERNLIREPTQAGLKAARARGRVEGRPKALNSDKRKLAVRLYEEKEHTVRLICEMMNISKPILYKYVESARSWIRPLRSMSCALDPTPTILTSDKE